MTKQIMLVTKQLRHPPRGGREMLCQLNYDALKEIYGDGLQLFELAAQSRKGPLALGSAIRGNIDGLEPTIIEAALDLILALKISIVFVDGSNLGEFAKRAKLRMPGLQVCSFFHNVEAKFFLGSLRQVKTARSLGVLVANYLAERKAVHYSDKLVCLSMRDSRLLKRIYGRAATHISAIGVRDGLPETQLPHNSVAQEKFALFVGGNFYANRAGICWFIENVAPRIDIKICIVGRGLDDIGQLLACGDRVEVVGSVDDLAEWYRDSQFVIAPIFEGSGMKTKVAEALMFGKKIVGTPEAFSGYDDIADRVGWTCSSADDFIAAIEQASHSISKSFDPQLRALYQQRYSYTAVRERLAGIIAQ